MASLPLSVSSARRPPAPAGSRRLAQARSPSYVRQSTLRPHRASQQAGNRQSIAQALRPGPFNYLVRKHGKTRQSADERVWRRGPGRSAVLRQYAEDHEDDIDITNAPDVEANRNRSPARPSAHRCGCFLVAFELPVAEDRPGALESPDGADVRGERPKSLVEPSGLRISSVPSMRSASFKCFAPSAVSLQRTGSSMPHDVTSASREGQPAHRPPAG